MCIPGPKESVSGTASTTSMRSARFAPRPPRSHIALPRQLMPSVATVDALNKKGGKVLGCIVEYFGCDFVD